MAINKITPEQRELMKKKSAQALPDVPSSKGWTPKQFKDSITKPLFDNDNSLYAHINRVAEEVDKTKSNDSDVVHKTGYLNETITGVKTFESQGATPPVRLKSGMPYVVSDTPSKVGMRAYTESGAVAGQFAVSYSEDYQGHFANIQASCDDGTTHTIRVSHLGPTYHTNKGDVETRNKLAFDEEVVHLNGNETISGEKTFTNEVYAETIKSKGNAFRIYNNNGGNQFQFEGSNIYINGTRFAKEPYVDNKIKQLIDGAPETLDTFKEVATYIESDKSAAAQMTANIQQNRANIENLEVKKANRTELFSKDYDELINAPEKLNFTIRDTISADTYNEAREIQIGKDKFKFGSGSKIKANEFVDGTLPTLEYLNIDGNTYKLPNYVVDKSGLKLVEKAYIQSADDFSITFQLSKSLEHNKLYYIERYDGMGDCMFGTIICPYYYQTTTNMLVIDDNSGECVLSRLSIYRNQYDEFKDVLIKALPTNIEDFYLSVDSNNDYINVYEIPLGESAQVEKHNKTINALMDRVSELEDRLELTTTAEVVGSTLKVGRASVVNSTLQIKGLKVDGTTLII